MAIGESEVGRKSLGDVHGSVGVSHGNPFKRLFAFLGPAYLVSVGYMDPGNWATDLEGGARFGYALIWVLLMSNLMAVILQTLSARLGVVTGHDLAQACRSEYSRPVNFALWALAEIAIAACDLAEVVGTVIALKLLFGMPLLWGCVVTAFDTFLLLWLQQLRDEEDGGRDPGPGGDDRRLFPDPDPAGQARPGCHAPGLPADLAAGLAVRRDRHPRRDGDASQPLLALGPGAVPAGSAGSGEQGAGVQVQPDRLGAGVERGVLRERGDPGSERGGLPRQGGGRQHRGGASSSCRASLEPPRRSCSGSPCSVPGRVRR